MKQYLELCRHIMDHGVEKEDRTGTGTISTFGYQMRFDLSKGFPLVTTKKLPFRIILSELLWFIAGDTNITYLLRHNNHIWDEWAFERYAASSEYKGPDMTQFGKRAMKDPVFAQVVKQEMKTFTDCIMSDKAFGDRWGDLGPVYGKQWRRWQTPDGKTVDQLANIVEGLKSNPDSRRHLVVAYNPAEVDEMVLPPCHSLFQFYVLEGKLSCQLYQRSGDTFLGIPFNIASYALLTLMLAQTVNLQPGEFIHTIGDAHIYKNHIEQVELQLSREPKALPTITINPAITSIFDYTYEDFELIGYDAYPHIKGEVSV